MNAADADWTKAARQVILVKYARLGDTGKPLTCTPSRAELAGDVRRKETPGTDNKIIYDTREAAGACGRELETLGTRPQRAVPCRRSKHGHFHLTTDYPAMKGRRHR